MSDVPTELPKPPRMSYTLKESVTFENTLYTEIKFRRPRGREIRAGGQYDNDYDRAFVMMSKLSGVPEGAFDLMDGYDVDQMLGIVAELMKSVPTTQPT